MDFRNFFRKTLTSAKNYVGIVGNELPDTKSRWNNNDFLSAFEISLYVNKAITKRAEKVGEIEFQLTDLKNNPIQNDDLINLLYKPNKLFTGRQFWNLYQKYYDLIGEVYIWIDRSSSGFGEKKKVNAMHLLNPIAVTPEFNADGSPKVFKYKAKSGVETKYKPEEIIYIHNPNPLNPLRGTSLLKAGLNAIETEVQIGNYHSRVLKNGGKVEGVFKFKTGALNENQLEEIKARYKKEYAGAKKAGMPLFLGGDAEYIRTGLNLEELAYLEAKKTSLQDICILTGVPQSVLAATNDVKFDNADADRVIFYTDTINPAQKTLATALDERLFPKDRLLTHINQTPENMEEKRKNLETANNIYALTTNEKREALKYLGIELDPVKGGDEVLVPFNLSPVGTEEKPKEEKSKGMKVDHPLKNYDVRRAYWDMQIKRMDSREGLFKKALNEYFNEQLKRLETELQPSNTRVFRKKDLIEDLFKIEIEVNIGKEKFIPILTELLLQAGIDAKEFAGSAGAFILSADMKDWIEARSDIFLRVINETTLKNLKQSFSESLASGEGREGLIERIQADYGGIKKSRAGMIARTEVHNATQFGTVQGYKQAGLSIKIWVAVMDGQTRESHASIDGEEQPIDMPFSNGLNFPGDPRGSAAEVINCRCVI